MKQNNSYSGEISEVIVKNEAYQCELSKLKEYYGFRVVLNSHTQAKWDREGAFERFELAYPFWIRLEAAKDIIATDFAMKIHCLLGNGKTTDEIMAKLGSFKKFQASKLYPLGNLLLGREICRALRAEGEWWKVTEDRI